MVLMSVVWWSSHVSSPVVLASLVQVQVLSVQCRPSLVGPRAASPFWFRRIGLGWGSGDPRGLGDLAGIGALCGQVDLETWLVLELGDMEGREGS